MVIEEGELDCHPGSYWAPLRSFLSSLVTEHLSVCLYTHTWRDSSLHTVGSTDSPFHFPFLIL